MKNNKQKTFSTLNILWRGLAAASSLFAIVAVSGCDMTSSYIDAVRDSTLESLDATRTVGQVFEDNPYVKSLSWKVVETRNGRIAVIATCMNESYPNDDTFNPSSLGTAMDFAYEQIIANVLRVNCAEISFVFLLSKDLEEYKLEKITMSWTDESCVKGVERINEYMNTKQLSKERVKSVLKNTKFPSSIEFKDEETGEMVESLFKKKPLVQL